MCGIAGFLGGKRFAPEEASSIARGMADTVAHRGPDDAGVWLDGEAEIALATGAWLSSIRRRPVANRCSPPPGEASSHSSLGAAWSIQGLVGSDTGCPAAAGGGFFDPWSIHRKWHEFLNMHEQCEQHLWHILMFQAWLEHVRRSNWIGNVASRS